MEIETACSAISTVGFPIFMCLLFFWDRVKTIEKLSTVIKSNTEALKRIEGSIKK